MDSNSLWCAWETIHLCGKLASQYRPNFSEDRICYSNYYNYITTVNLYLAEKGTSLSLSWQHINKCGYFCHLRAVTVDKKLGIIENRVDSLAISTSPLYMAAKFRGWQKGENLTGQSWRHQWAHCPHQSRGAELAACELICEEIDNVKEHWLLWNSSVSRHWWGASPASRRLGSRLIGDRVGGWPRPVLLCWFCVKSLECLVCS